MKEDYTKIICGECKHLILNFARPSGTRVESGILLVIEELLEYRMGLNADIADWDSFWKSADHIWG